MTDDLKRAAEKGIALRLADGTLTPLLPGSIADDPQIRAAAGALEPILRATALAVPNLLIFSRLGRQDPAAMLPPLRRLVEARGSLARPLRKNWWNGWPGNCMWIFARRPALWTNWRP